MKRWLSATIIASLLAGCGGGAVSPPPSGSGGSGAQGAKTVQATLKFTLNADHSQQARHREYISAQTKGLGITVMPWQSSGSQNFPASTAAMSDTTWATTIAPGFSGEGAVCTGTPPNNNGASYSCTIILTMPVGYDDVQLTTWDQAPISQGANPNAAQQQFCTSLTGPPTCATLANNLSFSNISDQYVQVNQNNTFNFTLGGIVNSVALNVTPSSLVDGAPSGSGTINPTNPTVYVRALDADGNTIIGAAGDLYYDAAGNPITITVTSVPTYAATPPPLGGPQGTVLFPGNSTTATFTSPTQTSATATYNGGDVDSVAFNVSIAESNAPFTVVTLNNVDTTLGFNRTDPGSIDNPGPPTITDTVYTTAPTDEPYFMTLGPILPPASQASVWFDAQSPSSVGQVTGSSTVTAYAVAPATINGNLVTGPDNALWFADGNNAVGRYNPSSGTVTEVADTNPTTSVTVGPDNTIWATEGTDLAQFDWSASGAPQKENEYTGLPALYALANVPDGSAAPNGHLWAINNVNPGKVYEISTAGAVVNTYTVTAGTPADITVGQDGNLWIDTYAPNQVYEMSPTGTFSTAIPLKGLPTQITSGTDGNIWVAARAGTQDEVARISTTEVNGAYPISEYTNGITACLPGDPHITGIAEGSNGDMFFTEWGCNRIGEVAFP